MMFWLAACTPEAPPSKGGDDDDDVQHTGAPDHTAEVEPTGDTGGDHTGGPVETAHTGEVDDDPFLEGDRADQIGAFEVVWYPVDEPTRWAFVGTTFRQGSASTSGTVVVAATTLDSCELTNRLETSYQLENFGAIEVFSGGGHAMSAVSSFDGVYFGEAAMVDVDPRGELVSFVVEGSYVPFFELQQAVEFPHGTLSVTAPLTDAEVDSSQPLAFRWSGTAAEYVEITVLSDDRRIRCAAVDDGAFDVDAAMLGALQPGRLLFGVYARNAAGPVAANGAWVQVQASQAIEGSFSMR